MNKLFLLFLTLTAAVVFLIIFFTGKSKEPQIVPPTKIEKAESALVSPEQETAEEAVSETSGAEGKVQLSPEEQEQEILDFLASWKKAWQQSAGKKGSIDDYLSFYSEDFNADGTNKERWGKLKRERNAKKEWIEIILNEPEIMEAENKESFLVTFTQEYNSPSYSDKSKKELTIRKENYGWKIISER